MIFDAGASCGARFYGLFTQPLPDCNKRMRICSPFGRAPTPNGEKKWARSALLIVDKTMAGGPE